MAWRCGAALQSRDNIRLRGSRPIHNLDIVYVELGRIAISRVALVVCALVNVKYGPGLVEYKALQSQVRHETDATTSAVRRIAFGHTGPGFDVGAVSSVVAGDVARCDILDDLKGIVELADAANGQTGSSVELAVFDQDVGRVRL